MRRDFVVAVVVSVVVSGNLVFADQFFWWVVSLPSP